MDSDPSVIAEKLLGIVKTWGFKERVYYSSFDPRMLTALREKDREVVIAFLYSPSSQTGRGSHF